MINLFNIKDSYNMRIINSPRWGGVPDPIQNLSSLGYDSNGIPTHLIDSVSGNNVDVLGGACFQGDVVGYYASGVQINFDLNTYNINVSFIIANPTGNAEFLLGSTSSGLRNWTLTSSSVEMRMGISPLTDFTASFTTGFIEGDFIQISLLTTGAWTATKTSLNGNIESDSGTGTVDTVARFVGFIGSNRNGVNPTGLGISELTIETVGNTRNRWTFSEKIVSPTTHTAYDIVGGNHATLINGSTANQGAKTVAGDWLQSGYLDDGVNQIVPILEDGTAFADGTPLTDPDAVLQDGTKWLRNGTKLKQSTTDAALIAADSQELWYTSGIANEVTDSNLVLFVASYPTIYGATYDTDFIKGITLTQI